VYVETSQKMKILGARRYGILDAGYDTTLRGKPDIGLHLRRYSRSGGLEGALHIRPEPQRQPERSVPLRER